jgi:hypothetical protein
MAEPATGFRAVICKDIIARIREVESIISALEHAGFRVVEKPYYSTAWVRISDILTKIRPDWGPDLATAVSNLLEYGQEVRPEPGPHRPPKVLDTWIVIARHVTDPANVFRLRDEVHRFDTFAKYVQSSPLVKSSDRLSFVSFAGMLRSLEHIILDHRANDFAVASQWGFSFSQQCGVMASWIEFYQSKINAHYAQQRAPAPVGEIDIVFDNVSRIVNAFPMYVTLVNAVVDVLTNLWRILLDKLTPDTAKSPTTVYANTVRANANAQKEVAELEAQIRRRLEAKFGKDEGAVKSEKIISAARAEVAARAG